MYCTVVKYVYSISSYSTVLSHRDVERTLNKFEEYATRTWVALASTWLSLSLALLPHTVSVKSFLKGIAWKSC